MDNFDSLAHLEAQRAEIPFDVAKAHQKRVFAAFRFAMDDLGLPKHPGGQCPTADCRCEALSDLVTARAYELMGYAPERALRLALEDGTQ